jgi:hypothetical protein
LLLIWYHKFFWGYSAYKAWRGASQIGIFIVTIFIVFILLGGIILTIGYHNLMPTHVTASLNKYIESNLEATAASHQAELERERERAERLMAELLRAKADALASRQR